MFYLINHDIFAIYYLNSEENPKEDHSSRFEEENEEKMSETEQNKNEAVEAGRTASQQNSARSQKSTAGVESPKDTQVNLIPLSRLLLIIIF